MVVPEIIQIELNEQDSYFEDENVDLRAQTFTPLSTFTLSKASIFLKKRGSPPSSAVITIRTTNGGEPTLNILSSGTILASSVGVGGSYIDIVFDKHPVLTQGVSYSLVLSSHGTSGNYIDWAYLDNDHYFDGMGCSRLTENTGTLVEAGFDFVLRVYGYNWDSVLTSYDEVLQKSGSTISANLAVGDISLFSVQAESQLNVRTRRNWTDIYSTLKEDVKYILNEVVSDLAAIKVINFSIIDYTSSLDAQRMIDNLTAHSEMLIKELKETSVQTFILGA